MEIKFDESRNMCKLIDVPEGGTFAIVVGGLEKICVRLPKWKVDETIYDLTDNFPYLRQYVEDEVSLVYCVTNECLSLLDNSTMVEILESGLMVRR